MVISRTPLRISLAGGGTDLPSYYELSGEGAVVNFTINKYIYVIINKRFDSKIKLNYFKNELVDSIDDIKNQIIKACLQYFNITNGIEITCISDVPSGTGLGSSSTLTVGLLNALHAYLNKPVDKLGLLQEAWDVELRILNKPIGKQDQAAAVFGGLNYFIFTKNDGFEYYPIKDDHLNSNIISDINSNLITFYTGMTHSADSILKSQKENTNVNFEALNLMRSQAARLYSDILNGNFSDNLGKSLKLNWNLKKSLVKEISNKDIDVAYQAALSNGALGGKLLGAGGGGFLLYYCPDDKMDLIQSQLELGLTEFLFEIELKGSVIIYNDSNNILG